MVDLSSWSAGTPKVDGGKVEEGDEEAEDMIGSKIPPWNAQECACMYYHTRQRL